MRRFAITAALVAVLSLGAAGTANAQHRGFMGSRMMPGMNTMNMGAFRTFPSFNSFNSNRFARSSVFVPRSPFNNFNTFVNPRFATGTAVTPGFNPFGVTLTNRGIVSPTLNNSFGANFGTTFGTTLR